MRLSELIEDGRAGAAADVEIRGLAADSREVRPGFLFAAIPGTRANGLDFLRDAIAHGAVAVLAPQDATIADACIPVLTDDNPRQRLALMAARFYGAQPETVAAVTGTNGKTSVAEYARQIWTTLGCRAASIGTLGLRGVELDDEVIHTTPEPVTLHRILARLREAGISNLAIEASSHGIHQCRLDGVELRAAAFTNISHDHLDYHPSAEHYRNAKLRLFDQLLPPDGAAALNADADEFDLFAAVAAGRGQRLITYGAREADFRLVGRKLSVRGQRLRVAFADAQHEVELGLIGEFQAWNALCALCVVYGCGADAGEAFAALESLEGAPGRMQLVAESARGARIYVDYSHTPDSLAKALAALRPHIAGRLHVAFGCGGDRDRAKRPKMGRIAAESADVAIVTDDNPRSEAPDAIRRAIMAACPDATEIGDRAEAIRHAIAGLRQGDGLLIAGKGHEQGQDFGGVVRPFDDARVARAAALELGGRPL